MNIPYPLVCCIHLIVNNKYIFIWWTHAFTAVALLLLLLVESMNFTWTQFVSMCATYQIGWLMKRRIWFILFPSSVWSWTLYCVWVCMLLSKWHRLNRLRIRIYILCKLHVVRFVRVNVATHIIVSQQAQHKSFNKIIINIWMDITETVM